jgi:hypothetical protein
VGHSALIALTAANAKARQPREPNLTYSEEKIMNSTQKWIISIGTTLSLGLAATAVSAHPNQMGDGMQHGTRSGEQHGMHGGMGQGMRGGKWHGNNEGKGTHGARHGERSPQAAQQLMTPEERTAMREKMRTAKTPEERQQIATANRTEMEKRAKEKGISPPEHRGPHGRHGAGPAATPPATTEQAR